jgi:hypothetical protein
MKEKLAAKFKQGFSGWDSTTPAARGVLYEKFLDHVASQMEGVEEWVDLANFCMFLYRIDRADDEISA